jgi:F-type H+-transporting ATPase subunit epsilon
MSEKLVVSIVTPNGTIFNGDAKQITLPGKEGEFGVLSGHASTLCLLSAGVIEIKKNDNDTEHLLINWGYSKINSNSVDILADNVISLDTDNNDISDVIKKYDSLLDSISDSNILLASVRSRVENILNASKR